VHFVQHFFFSASTKPGMLSSNVLQRQSECDLVARLSSIAALDACLRRTERAEGITELRTKMPPMLSKPNAAAANKQRTPAAATALVTSRAPRRSHSSSVAASNVVGSYAPKRSHSSKVGRTRSSIAAASGAGAPALPAARSGSRNVAIPAGPQPKKSVATAYHSTAISGLSSLIRRR